MLKLQHFICVEKYCIEQHYFICRTDSTNIFGDENDDTFTEASTSSYSYVCSYNFVI